MNVLIYNQSFFAISETFVHRQVLGLSRHHQVTMLAYRFENQDRFPVDVAKVPLRPYRNILDMLITKVLRKLSGQHYGMSFLNQRFVSQLIKENKRDLIHAHFGPSGIDILPVARQLNVPVVASFHGIDAAPAMLDNKEYERKVQDLISYASAVIIVSPHFKDTLKLDKHASKVHLIPYGIDEQKFKPRTGITSRAHGKVIIQHVGRLVPKKGAPDLIRVFGKLSEKYDDIELRIIGDGPEMEMCKVLIADLHLSEKVLLLGSQPHDAVSEKMHDADIYVLNSRIDDKGDMEGLPNSILEAMSMEKAVVSTYHAGIPQAIQNGENGLLVNEKDNDGLFAALESLIGNGPLRHRLGVAARKTVVSKFSAASMEASIQAVVAQIPVHGR
jgi:colanic acid/amylovoran biosynthesis glycosyltransferase